MLSKIYCFLLEYYDNVKKEINGDIWILLLDILSSSLFFIFLNIYNHDIQNKSYLEIAIKSETWIFLIIAIMIFILNGMFIIHCKETLRYTDNYDVKIGCVIMIVILIILELLDIIFIQNPILRACMASILILISVSQN